MQMIKLNNKGFGRKELMFVLLIIVVIAVVVTYKFINENDATKFTSFKRMASAFANDAGVLRDSEFQYEERVYLYDVINLEYGDELQSPFNGKEQCDVYESKIEMVNRKVYLTFKCSEYYINHQPTTDEYKIYKVSEWTEEPIGGDNVQTETFYNYYIGENQQLDKFLIEKEFLVEYNRKTGYNIHRLSEVRNEHVVMTKTFYRTIEEVQ